MSECQTRIQSVLFVCSGNIFRSLAAEHALKMMLGKQSSCLIGSAGIDARPQPVHEWVQTRLLLRGADVTAHVQRQLTREMVKEADLVIAMGRNHQAYIRERFERDVASVLTLQSDVAQKVANALALTLTAYVPGCRLLKRYSPL